MTTAHLDPRGPDGPADATKTPTPARRRAGKGWWGLAVVAAVAGSATGITASYLAKQSTTPHATSNQVITSTGGTFHRASGPAPGWTLPSLRDTSAHVTLAQFKGRPVVINFWASWCPPCRKEMPALAATARRVGANVAFVGIDTNDERGAALAFAAKTGVAYPLAFDPHATAGGNYGVYGLPTTFFVSAKGDLVGEQVGGMTSVRLSQLLKQTFGLGAPSNHPGS